MRLNGKQFLVLLFLFMVSLIYVANLKAETTVYFTNKNTQADGYVKDNNNATTNQTRFRIGEWKAYSMARGFFSIPVSLPANIIVTSATLQIERNQYAAAGDPTVFNPYYFSLVDFGGTVNSGDYNPASTNLHKFLTYNDPGSAAAANVYITNFNVLNAVRCVYTNGLSSFSVMIFTEGTPTGGTNFLAISDTGATTNQILKITYIPAIPDTPTNFTATLNPNDYESTILSWDDVDNETSYTLFRNTSNDTNTGIIVIGGVGADVTSFIDTGLAANTKYYYWVKSYLGLNASGYSLVASNFTAVPATPPATPQFYTAEFSGTNVNVIWQNVANETNYSLYWSVTNDFSTASIVTNPAKNITNIIFTGADLYKTNYFWIRANNDTGSSGTNVKSAYLENAYAPSWITSSVDTVNHRVVVNWAPVSTATSYTLFRNTVNNSATASSIAGVNYSISSFTDASVAVNTTYYYWVKAYNVKGASDFSSSTSVSIPVVWPPDTPANLNVIEIGTTSVKIQWSNVSNETYYAVYRNTVNSFSDAVQIAQVNTDITNYTDTSVVPETTYYYWIKAFNAGGSNPPTSVASVTTMPSINLKTYVESIDGKNNIKLEWSLPSGINNITDFRIYKSTSPIKTPLSRYIIVSNNIKEYSFSLDKDNTYYFNVGYSTNGIDYLLDGPAAKFVVININPNNLGFNSKIEFIPRYDYAKNLSTAGVSEILGDLITAYQIKVYKIGPEPEIKIVSYPDMDEPISYILDGDTNTANYCRAKDSYYLFDLGAVVRFTNIKLYGALGGYGEWGNLTLLVAENEAGPWSEVAIYHDVLGSKQQVLSIDIDEKYQKTRYVKIVGDSPDDPYDLVEVKFGVTRYMEEYNTSGNMLPGQISVSFPYNDVNNNGYPETYDMSSESSYAENKLSVFLFNNNTWKYLGGTVDTVNKLVNIDLSLLGLFGIFPATEKISSTVSFSKKYITPDNSSIMINIKPKSSVKLSVKIYDISGRLVRTLADDLSVANNYSLIWDGKDDSGNELNGGTYIYEVRFDGKKEEAGVVLLVK